LNRTIFQVVELTFCAIVFDSRAHRGKLRPTFLQPVRNARGRELATREQRQSVAGLADAAVAYFGSIKP